MRSASWLVAIACACGGASQNGPHAPAQVAPAFSAARWIPAHPTYALAAKTLRDAQRGVTELFATLGVLIDVDASQLGHELARLIVVDPLVPEQLTAIGIDVEGGFAVFSEAVSPTLVVRVSGQDQLQTFFQQQRDRGMKTSSVIAGDVEVFSTRASAGLTLSWALDGDWLWVHFGTPVDREPGADWFMASHHPGPPAWAERWKPTTTARLAGFVDVRALLGKLPKISDAIACARLLEPVGSLGFSVTLEGSFAGVAVAADVGPAASATLRKALLPPPGGWDATARKAPLAAQWNLDLAAVRNWIAPCVTVAGFDPFREISGHGIRAVRAILMSFDGDSSGTGAVAADVASMQAVTALLDRIPMRETLASPKTFGPYRGSSIDIPFGPTLEYVVTDALAIAAVGDGVLARVIGRGPAAATSTVLGIDVLPGGLSADAWTWLFDRAGIPARKRGVERLQRWRDLHLSLRLEGTQLVLEASGNRG